MPDPYQPISSAWSDPATIQALGLSMRRHMFGPVAAAPKAQPRIPTPTPERFHALEALGFIFPQDIEQRTDAGLVLLPERCDACGRKHTSHPGADKDST